MENSDSNSNNMSIVSREKLDQLAMWLGATVASAFFSSIERFSCVNLTTTDSDDDDEGPLTLSATNQSSTSLHDLPDRPKDFVNLPV